MCGIAGTAGPGAGPGPLEAALGRLFHRGPDDGQISSGPGYAIGYRRLAIRAVGADFDAGRQPFRSGDGRVTLYGVGEVYNFDELAVETAASVHPCGGDIASLLAVYLRDGIAGLARVRGEFACVIRDERTGQTILARDTAGIKPLFWTVHEGRLHFASEIKGLAALGVPLTADPHGIAAYLRFNYPVPPRTWYEGVRSVAPGTALVWTGGTAAEVPFATLDMLALDVRSEDEDIPGLLADAVTSRLVSDVPLGFHLSGGVDSSLVCVLAGAAGAPAYTLEYDPDPAGPRGDAWWAAQVAGENRLRQRLLRLTEQQATHEIDAFIATLDAPIMSPGALTPYFVARAAREDKVPLLLAGQGSDEVFLGYKRYAEAADAGLGELAGIAANGELADLHTVAPGWRTAFEDVDRDIGALAGPAAEVSSLSAFQMLYLRSFLQEILRIEDHAHTAWSVENRPPLLDTAVIAAGLSRGARMGKAALGKQVLHKMLSDRGSVAAQRPGKQQMAITMQRAGGWARGVLTGSDAVDALGFCNADAVRALATAEQVTRRQQRLLWALANLVRWSALSGVKLS
ncbi:asparagine synthetase B [Actinoplanes sp. TFC3]|uniref:asparagine synthetase B family protein n=1 Tax=Actinoplanes sp. TFC3 TaxID=1710355 RepID=UPI000832E1BC|nr:asparagine synthase-related protein [Actinoplanes sp. TFC3]